MKQTIEDKGEKNNSPCESMEEISDNCVDDKNAQTRTSIEDNLQDDKTIRDRCDSRKISNDVQTLSSGGIVESKDDSTIDKCSRSSAR